MKTSKTLKLVVCASLAILFSVNSVAEQSDIDAIEDAFNRGDSEKMQQLITSTEGYEHFLANYRQALQQSFHQQQKEAQSTLEDLIEKMETHTTTHPDDAESLALLANVYGYSIGLNPLKAMSYGPRSHDRIRAALAINNESPRVLMFEGIIAYNTPAMFGGSKQKAKAAFDQALAVFPADKDSGMHWGYSDTQVWLGLTHLELDNIDMARHYWQQALATNSQNNWAKHLLESNQAR